MLIFVYVVASNVYLFLLCSDTSLIGKDHWLQDMIINMELMCFAAVVQVH